MKKTLTLGLLMLGMLSGCTTIYFDKGKNAQSTVTTQKWHHNFAFGLYEGSEPVNPKQECGTKPWVSVKTEQSFVNGLASGAVNTVGPIWYPKTVEVTCK